MIIITGASDGLGLQLAKLYQAAGKKVVNVSRQTCTYADVNIACDLREDAEIEAAVARITEEDEVIEALVQCAGVLSIQPPNDVQQASLHDLMLVNIEAQILLVSKLFDRLVKDNSDIVNVSSTVGTKAYPSQAAYGASKWAVRGFSENLRVEFKDLPNRVISFCPGGFESDIFEKATGSKNQDFTHWMKPYDIAVFIKQILDLPKNMEVSEVIINRKASK